MNVNNTYIFVRQCDTDNVLIALHLQFTQTAFRFSFVLSNSCDPTRSVNQYSMQVSVATCNDPSNVCLPPLNRCFGTRLNHGDSCLPFLNSVVYSVCYHECTIIVNVF